MSDFCKGSKLLSLLDETDDDERGNNRPWNANKSAGISIKVSHWKRSECECSQGNHRHNTWVTWPVVSEVRLGGENERRGELKRMWKERSGQGRRGDQQFSSLLSGRFGNELVCARIAVRWWSWSWVWV
ncbi:hypothetical protein VTL71DRAFT_3211 [Oculimacula yallundae]|uniref:Uncharacterized protein n=1 Tax=Oculimacula yallundae TaxID=86028 RepID=A0ABR4C7N5_9HELO